MTCNVAETRDPDVDAAWAEEVECRIRQIEAGELKTIPWSEVRAKLYARLATG
ncbi:MAG TPA: addiction module protein [Thermoanaerobaculia bacterium]|nr:addiction module protein [Thermoanaerobaculia bacterium]